MADNPIQQRAAFAETFMPSATGERRRRYASDIAAGDAFAESVERTRFQSRMENDPEFARTQIANRRLNQDIFEDQRDADLAERRFDWDMEKARRAESLDREQFDLEIRKEKRMLGDAEDLLRTKKRMEDDTEAVLNRVRILRDEEGRAEGDPQYSAALMDELSRRPFVDPKYRDQLIDQLGVGDDAATVMRRLQAIRAQGMEPMITEVEDGLGGFKTTIRGRPKPDPQRDYDNALDEWREATRLRSSMSDGLDEKGMEKVKSGFSAQDLKLADELKTRAAQRLNKLKPVSGSGTNPEAVPPAGGTAPSAAGVPAAAPAQAANLPTVTTKEQRDALPVGAKYIRDGVTYTKQ